MNLKITTALAAAILLGACQTPPCDEEMAEITAPVESKFAIESEEFKAIGDRVFFAFDKSNLDSEAQATLDKQAAWLKKYPEVGVVVEGHCDKRGTREYNLALGERRAVAAKKFLEHKGIANDRIKTVSFGKDVLPAGQGDSERVNQLNRTAITRPE